MLIELNAYPLYGTQISHCRNIFCTVALNIIIELFLTLIGDRKPVTVNPRSEASHSCERCISEDYTELVENVLFESEMDELPFGT